MLQGALRGQAARRLVAPEGVPHRFNQFVANHSDITRNRVAHIVIFCLLSRSHTLAGIDAVPPTKLERKRRMSKDLKAALENAEGGQAAMTCHNDSPAREQELNPSDEDFGHAAGATVDERLEASQQGAAQALARQQEAHSLAARARETLAAAIEAGDVDAITQAESEATQAAAESDEAAKAAASFQQARSALEDVQRLQKRQASIGGIGS